MRRLIPLLIPILLLFLIPLLPVELFYIDFLLLLYMYAINAMGWNILAGYTGYVSFGHAAFFGVGAYTTAILMDKFGVSPFITSILGGLAASIFASLIGYPTLRLKGAYFAITTLSFGFVMEILFLNLESITGGAHGISLPLPPWDIRTFKIIFYYAFLISLLLVTYTTYKLERSRLGLALKCIRDNELAAESIGIPTTTMKMIAFMLSALFLGISGGLYSYYATYIDPPTAFSPNISMYAIVMTILGGGGTVLGPIIGAIILFTISQFTRYTFTVPGIDLMIFSGVAILVILFMPEGIVGRLREREVEIP